MAAKKEQPDMVTIEVTVDNHTHNGEPCEKGRKINVSKRTAEMLEKAWAGQGKAEKAEEPIMPVPPSGGTDGAD